MAEVDKKDVVINEFQKAVRASEAATKYGLPGLQQLAKTEMERWGADMDLHDAVRAVSEDSIAKPMNENTWLQDFVSQKVRLNFELNAEVFSEPDFYERISSPTLTKFLARNVVSLYSEKVLDLQKEKLANGKPPPSENGGRILKWVNPYAPPHLPLVPVPEPISDASFVDAFQEPSTVSKKLLNKQETEEIGCKELAEEDAERLKGDHEETDRVQTRKEGTAIRRMVEEVSVMKLAEPKVAAEAEYKQEEDPWIEWGGAAISSKMKKKKKGADSDFNVPLPAAGEAEPDPERALEPPLPESAPEAAPTVEPTSAEIEEEVWGEAWGGTKKKSKKAKAKAMYETPPPEREPAREMDLLVPNMIGVVAGAARSTVRTTTIPGSEDCPRRLEHVFEGGGWKNCKLCQVHMRGIASELHAAGF
ncbi:hypothetical protein E8E12_003866 [Didymella heteroderae]|uniref:Uncharacterized protein n=1 Tax=Didymella heteroderae TaxID=1769908 RepID=A0A9P4WHQ5_9PLEO|nr:hypothetical protein E8E12_003866 [Didymella heteroderae]